MNEVHKKIGADDVPPSEGEGAKPYRRRRYGRKASMETGQHALPGAGGDGELRQ